MSLLSPVDEQLPEPARQALAGNGYSLEPLQILPRLGIQRCRERFAKSQPLPALKQAEMCIRTALCTKKNPQALWAAGFVRFSGQSKYWPLCLLS
jgi:hypothetical protein